MSPRYFSKFSESRSSEESWYHFTPSEYHSDSYELKMYLFKLKILSKIKKLIQRLFF